MIDLKCEESCGEGCVKRWKVRINKWNHDLLGTEVNSGQVVCGEILNGMCKLKILQKYKGRILNNYYALSFIYKLMFDIFS